MTIKQFKSKRLHSGVYFYLLLAAIFGAGLVVTIFSGAIYGSVLAFFEPRPAAQTAPADYPKISQDLRGQLSGLLNPESEFSFNNNTNAFADATNVAAGMGAGGGAFSPASANSAASPLKPGGLIVPRIGGGGAIVGGNSSVLPQVFPSAQPVIVNQTPAPPVSNESTTAELSARFIEREMLQLKSAGRETMLPTRIYGVEDVLPVGVAGTRQKRGIMFYAPKTKESFTTTLGAEFRDGTVADLTDAGVVFRRHSGGTFVAKWSSQGTGSRRKDADTLLKPEVKPRSEARTATAPAELSAEAVPSRDLPLPAPAGNEPPDEPRNR